ncbi:MAG: hypothetical protein JXB32_09135 [Deltaproteobacteria bacterium]|nr:hypothetical protein [Deltaproteobacteria bacterium]
MHLARTLLRSLPAAVLVAACGPGTTPAADEPASPPPGTAEVAPEDLGFVLTAPDLARSLERFAGQYGRVLERLAALDVALPAPPPETVRDTGRVLLRELVFRRILQLPGELAIDLAAPTAVGAVVPRGGEPSLAAGVGVISTGPRDRLPRSLDPEVVLRPAADDRLAIGYFAGPAADLATMPAAEADSDDDLVFRAAGIPAAERARRALLGWAGPRRERGELTDLDELLVTGGSIALDLLSGIRDLRVGLRLGEGDAPAVSLRIEVTPEPGTPLAAALPAEDAAADDFPFVGDVGPGPAQLFAARPGPGTNAVRDQVAGAVDRLFALFERTALPELTAHVAELGRAAGDLVRLLDGRYLDVSWPGTGDDRDAGDEGPFLALALGFLPQRTMILGVTSHEAARNAARRACAALEELGPCLMDVFGGPLDIGCQHETARLGDVPVDVVVVRDRLEPWAVEAGLRPFSVDVYFAAGDGRLVAATGADWRPRLEAALGLAAPPDGRLADDAAWAALREGAPAWATALGRSDLASLLAPELGRLCPEAPDPAPTIPVLLWGGTHEGLGRAELRTPTSFADDLARTIAAGTACGVFP